jgi:hypothetical protein
VLLYDFCGSVFSSFCLLSFWDTTRDLKPGTRNPARLAQHPDAMMKEREEAVNEVFVNK